MSIINRILKGKRLAGQKKTAKPAGQTASLEFGASQEPQGSGEAPGVKRSSNQKTEPEQKPNENEQKKVEPNKKTEQKPEKKEAETEPEVDLTLEMAMEKTEQKKQENSKKGRAAQAMKFNFAERKKLLMTFERKNKTRIYFTEGKSSDWVMIYHNSALFFDRLIKPNIGSKAEIRSDTDFDARSSIGCIRYPGKDKLVSKTLGLVRGVEEPAAGIYALVLKKAVTGAELRMYMDEANSIVETANKIVMPEVVFPDLHFYIRDLAERVSHMVHDLDEPFREMVGYPLFELLSNMTVEYVCASSEPDGAADYLRRMKDMTNEARGRYMVLSWVNVLDPEKLRVISEGLSKIKNEVTTQMARIAYKETKNG